MRYRLVWRVMVELSVEGLWLRGRSKHAGNQIDFDLWAYFGP